MIFLSGGIAVPRGGGQEDGGHHSLHPGASHQCQGRKGVKII